MHKLLPFCLILFAIRPALAEDETQALLEKAIHAHGGAEKLKELEKKAAISITRGTVNQMGGLDVTIETYASERGKFKNILETEVMGVKVVQIQVFDGENFWLNVNGMDLSSLLDKNALAEAKEQLYQETVISKVLMRDKSIELSPLGEIAVEGKSAVGLRATSKGHRDVNLYFDKETGQTVKVEFRAMDILSNQEKLTERFLSDYKELDGYPRPTRVSIHQDGAKLLDLHVIEVRIFDTIDDSEFAKP